MRHLLLRICALGSLVLGSAAANAQLLYSFEPGEVAFGGTGATVTTDMTTGVTHGTQSSRVTWSGTFVGTRTAEVTDPAIINIINSALATNTPVSVDVTVIPQGGPTGTFSDMGITIFQGGNQFQTVSVPYPRPDDASRPSTATVNIPLLDFTTQQPFAPFNPNGSFIFQIYLNNQFQPAPATILLDNVRVPEPGAGLVACGALVGLLRRGRRGNQ